MPITEKPIVINTRVLASRLTGSQRYVMELSSRLAEWREEVYPSAPLGGIRGHAWEQFILPMRVGGKLLWSPSNTGPLAVERQVVTLHDVVPMDHPEWLNPRFAAWYRFLTPRLARRVRGILAVSEFTKQRIVAHCPESEAKIRVVYNGVDGRFHPIGADEIKRVRFRLGIPSEHYLVTLGSLEPRKNLPRLLQAWAGIQSRIPDDVWLVLAGAQGKRTVFGEVHFEELPPRVHLTGHVSDELLPALYSGAIASPYLSLYEGFGLPPLEAMACGTPPLTSNLASLPEVVGDAGILVNPNDVDAIAEGIYRLVEDSQLREALRDKGLIRASQFSWEKTAGQTRAFLEEVAARARFS
jgi:glycosyltransferase involved in cell wall biosynthesis